MVKTMGLCILLNNTCKICNSLFSFFSISIFIFIYFNFFYFLFFLEGGNQRNPSSFPFFLHTCFLLVLSLCLFSITSLSLSFLATSLIPCECGSNAIFPRLLYSQWRPLKIIKARANTLNQKQQKNSGRVFQARKTEGRKWEIKDSGCMYI